ncbi:hypothetical protein ACA910_010314 [Epithemia clementina (nom. ined.)]
MSPFASHGDNNKAAADGHHEHYHPHHQRHATNTDISRTSLTLEDLNEEIHDFATHDSDEDKTWTRRVVECYLSKFKWYYSMRDTVGGPSLSEAYAFYEHVTLPRHYVGSDYRAEPGEIQPTRLYDPWRTHAATFAEWGIGVDMYFSTLKMVSAMLLFAGLLNLRNMKYYASTDYSSNGQEHISSIFLKGSALCTTMEWVVCRDCEPGDYELEELSRAGIAEDGSFLVQHNDCNGADLVQGMVNYATFFILLGSMIVMSYYLRVREVRADEDKLTATDYSVVVHNPPPKAYDPNEWRSFFQQFGDVTCVTVALDNDEMLRKLTARRIELQKLRLLFPDDVNMDDHKQILAAIKEFDRQQELESSSLSKYILNPLLIAMGMVVPPIAIYSAVERLTEEVRKLQKVEYDVRNVFVTFETEDAQRKALYALSVGKLDIWMNNVKGVAPEIVFRDRVLSVEEPVEPDSVRWLDLSSSLLGRATKRFFNLFVTAASLAISGMIVGNIRSRHGPYVSGLLVSVFNSIIPEVVNMLMTQERHLTEESFQTSLYVKITLFRFVNTAILASVISPLTGTLIDGNEEILPSIKAILVSELYVTPLLSLLDISSNINKHYFAPRAKTQDQMNSYFYGTQYSIGERYTGLTNILFVCFFYSALFPAAFFFGAIILIVKHYTDKYCLMRIWARQPMVGSRLARFSRRYFFYGSLVASLLVSAYMWAQYPYDNVCEPANDPSFGHAKDYLNVQVLNGTRIDRITVTQDTDFRYCGQSWLETDVFPFPPTSRLESEDLKYMSDSQRKLVDFYGWTAFVILVLYIILAFGTGVMDWFVSFFKGVYAPSGMVQNIDYSSNAEIYGYIPQIKLVELAFPVLACDVDGIHQELIGWKDEGNCYDFHNMIFDVPYEGMKRKIRSRGNLRSSSYIGDQDESAASETTTLLQQPKPIFSIVKHYPPPWLKKQLQAEKKRPQEEQAPTPSVDETDTASEPLSQSEREAQGANDEATPTFNFFASFMSRKPKTT